MERKAETEGKEKRNCWICGLFLLCAFWPISRDVFMLTTLAPSGTKCSPQNVQLHVFPQLVLGSCPLHTQPLPHPTSLSLFIHTGTLNLTLHSNLHPYQRVQRILNNGPYDKQNKKVPFVLKLICMSSFQISLKKWVVLCWNFLISCQAGTCWSHYDKKVTSVAIEACIKILKIHKKLTVMPW